MNTPHTPTLVTVNPFALLAAEHVGLFDNDKGHDYNTAPFVCQIDSRAKAIEIAHAIDSHAALVAERDALRLALEICLETGDFGPPAVHDKVVTRARAALSR